MNILLSCVLLGFSIIANANDNSSMNVNSSDSSFIVKLAANPTTGYQWSVVKFDKDFLTLSSSQYQKPQSQLIGAGGQMFYTFTLKKGKRYPDKTNIVFKYSRAWEATGGSLQKITVYFVKEGKS